MQKVGAYRAKTKLSQLLREVAKGKEIVITHHGKGIARLVPEMEFRKKRPASEVIEEILHFRPQKDCSHLDTQELREEGRR